MNYGAHQVREYRAESELCEVIKIRIIRPCHTRSGTHIRYHMVDFNCNDGDLHVVRAASEARRRIR